METIAALSNSTYEALMRDYWLWVGIFAIVLVFGVYVFLFPNAIDFFVGSTKEQTNRAEIKAEGSA